MSPRKSKESVREELNDHQSAFLQLLRMYADCVITETDLRECFPDINWTGNIAATWRLLQRDELLAPHLRVYGEGKTRAYAYLSDPENDTLLKQRLLTMVTELENPEMFQDIQSEGLEVDERAVHRWWKIAVYAGVAVTAMSATGAAIYHKVHKSR